MPRRKIPTKVELIRLQKLYKTDEKIAERLGNVTPQLVAYWRRKKNIPRHSFPKFSFDEIRDLWERYGDDYRCGLELGISKAAFYNWRRKYNLKQKPSFLKLEQLELKLEGPLHAIGKRSSLERQSISQKIIMERAGCGRVEPGETIDVEPDLVVMYEDTFTVINEFQQNGLNFIWNPNRVVIALDHSCPADSVDMAEKHKRIREFARMQNIKYFYDVQEGICHLVVVENGHVLPGQLALGTARSISSLGSVGALAINTNVSSMTDIWSNGKISITVPHSIKILINGKFPAGTYAKDLILFIASKLEAEHIKGRVIEFYGATVTQMSMAERFTLTNLAIEMGASTAICSFDSAARRYMLRRTRMPYRPALADKNAEYEQTYEFNIDNLTPQAACPHAVNEVEAVANIENIPINQVVIGTCANGWFDDLRIAADILKGKKIHPDVRVLISPGSKAVYLEALKKGLLRAFVEAGAIVLNPGCGNCFGAGQGALAAGEKCLATSNNNSRGRMGSPGADIYLVSPATAAASAIKGLITDPTGYAG